MYIYIYKYQYTYIYIILYIYNTDVHIYMYPITENGNPKPEILNPKSIWWFLLFACVVLQCFARPSSSNSSRNDHADFPEIW